jgi:hypothetical protein
MSRDPLGAFEVWQHQYVEQFGAWGRAERVEASPQPALEFGRDARLGDFGACS